MDHNSLNFPPLSVSALNCNTLNLSSIGSFNHRLKLYGILKLRTDIIILSDVRIKSKTNVSAASSICNTFRTNPYGSYDFLYNSTDSVRGVGILLKKSCGFTVLSELREPKENALLLRIRKKGTDTDFLIGGVYCPNKNDPAFFTWINNQLLAQGDIPIILGGDWNTCVSSENVHSNIDLLNMASIPNKPHSELLQKICNDHDLCDPF